MREQERRSALLNSYCGIFSHGVGCQCHIGKPVGVNAMKATIDRLTAEVARLKELLATERMSADKTLEHNNRLINEVDNLKNQVNAFYEEMFDYKEERDRLREALEKIIAYDMADRIDAAKDIARAALAETGGKDES